MVEFKPLTKRCNRPAEKIQKVKSKTFFFIKLIINPNNDWLSMKMLPWNETVWLKSPSQLYFNAYKKLLKSNKSLFYASSISAVDNSLLSANHCKTVG